jgi:hypothetical protein
MANKVLKTGNEIAIRIDEVFTTNEKYLVTPYTKPDGSQKFFGSFKFKDPDAAKATLKQGVDLAIMDLGVKQDTVFSGQYPKWKSDNYGQSLEVQNKVKFFKDKECTEEVNPLEIRDGVFSLEIHLKKTKDDGIFLVAARAILTSIESRYNDDLFEEDDLPF